jgi:peptide chain release factor 1
LDATERYRNVLKRFAAIEEELGRPATINNQKRFTQLAKERGELEAAVSAIKRLFELRGRFDEDTAIIETSGDRELIDLAEAEIDELKEEMESVENKIQVMLLPKDPDDSRNTVLEIRAGTGGEEAALFCADLARMYRLYAENQNWKVEVLSRNPTGIGGFKEIIYLISGRNAYGKLKFERGVHRVQRVPVTESGGRIHTSAVSVAVLPEAEEVDVAIDQKDLRIDVYRSSGPGGQSVNTTDSAVRVTHIPTGMVVTCQDEKSQHKNKAKALKVLRARLKEKVKREQEAEIAQARRSMIGSGDRSAKIRTYNYPQGRVTDHRIGLTVHNLHGVINGDIDEIVRALALAYREELINKELDGGGNAT